MKRFVSFLSAALLTITLLVQMVPVSADSGTSSGLSITPRKNYVINPGDSVTDKLTIGNLSTSVPLDLTLRMVDFTFMDQSGTPKLFIADNAPTQTWSLRPYTSLPQAANIKAGGRTSINYTIKIPKNLGAGSYYSAILYSSGGGSGKNVNLNASGVTLVFVSVPGIVDEKLTLKKLGAYHSPDGGVTGSYQTVNFSNTPPERIGYTLLNDGNVAESPSGTITLKNFFTRKTTMITAINLNQSLALRGQTRLFTACIKAVQKSINFNTESVATTTCTNSGLMPGFYTVSLDAFYGQNGNKTQEVIGTSHFLYLPWWVILITIAIILIIVYFVRKFIRKIKNIGKKTVNRRS